MFLVKTREMTCLAQDTIVFGTYKPLNAWLPEMRNLMKSETDYAASRPTPGWWLLGLTFRPRR